MSENFSMYLLYPVLLLQPYAELKLDNTEHQKVIKLEAELIPRLLQKWLRIYSKKMRLKIKIKTHKENNLDKFAKSEKIN